MSKATVAIILAYVAGVMIASLLLGFLVSNEAQLLFIPFVFVGGIVIGVWRAMADF